VTTVVTTDLGQRASQRAPADRAAEPLVAILVIGHWTGRILLADARTVREATGPDLPVRLTPTRDRPAGRRPGPEAVDEIVDRLTAAAREVVPPRVPLVLAGHPRAVDRAAGDERLLPRLAATIPGHHEHTAPAVLRSHALRVLRRRS
jgi:hypothetical protein